MTLPFAELAPLISSASILIGLIVSAFVIVLFPDWRLALYALTAQYLLSAILLVTFVQPSLAIVRAISGALAAAILYVTMRQNVSHAVDRVASATAMQHPVFVVGPGFRLFALAFVAVSIIAIAATTTFFDLSAYVLFGGLWLIALGVLIAIVSRDVLRLGVGILMLTGGCCILETAVEGSLILYGLLNIADLLLAVVVAHLATLPHDETSPRRRRGEAR